MPKQWHNVHTRAPRSPPFSRAPSRYLLAELKSYARDEPTRMLCCRQPQDGQAVRGLVTAIFVLEWAALTLAFLLRLDDEDELHAMNWQSSHVLRMTPSAATSPMKIS
ncbi:hypothetical protein U9M48_018177 [Paspalum notatum var. saurae]|uniref:Uncharacterized protein n=1 Tax=Paspalum notatum var. saurae TaxID=547442 RepID=A0AAQ3TC83_PASNO